MDKYTDLTVKEIFDLAIKSHTENNLEEAKNLYNQTLKKDPNHFNALNNLGSVFFTQDKKEKAKEYYEKAIKINPNYTDAYNNLGISFKELKDYQKAISCYEKAIEIDSNFTKAHNNLGIVFKTLGEYKRAKNCFEKAIEIDSNFAKAHNNLGVVFKILGEYKRAKNCFEKAIQINQNHLDANFNLGNLLKETGEIQKARNYYEKAIEIDPNYVKAHNNLGLIFDELGKIDKARDSYEKAIEINPSYDAAHWNLHSLSSSIDVALSILEKIHTLEDDKFFETIIMIGALRGFKGDFKMFNDFLASTEFNHRHIRSVKWVFSLPKLPKLFFNRWDFFDFAVAESNSLKPFYEFGVWNAISFQYLINTFKKGFGFDTFTGLPEAWHNQPKGKYSAFGAVPKIEGGEFIVGKFEDTLPKFFAQERPVASLINFDADLYSSTLCALNNSKKVIDENTILVFDEFIMNDNWEEDEYKALNEFCENLGYSYEVIAVSFFTKQVAVRINR